MKLSRFGNYVEGEVSLTPFKHHMNGLQWMVHIVVNAFERKFAVVARNGEEAAHKALEAWRIYQAEYKSYLKWEEQERERLMNEEYGRDRGSDSGDQYDG
jgi:uncharacterized protein YifE (UPF0438 family)